MAKMGRAMHADTPSFEIHYLETALSFLSASMGWFSGKQR